MYYKVVNSNLSSAFISSGMVLNSIHFTVLYKINEWVEPTIKGSKLMVFDSLEEAENFLNIFGWGDVIYKCEAKNPNKTGLFIKGNMYIYNDLLKILDLKRKKKKFSHLLDEPIPGTIFCDAVKLVEKV